MGGWEGIASIYIIYIINSSSNRVQPTLKQIIIKMGGWGEGGKNVKNLIDYLSEITIQFSLKSDLRNYARETKKKNWQNKLKHQKKQEKTLAEFSQQMETLKPFH